MISITHINKRMIKSLLLMMLFLAQAVGSSAQVKLYMEDFTMYNGEYKTVSLILENDVEVTALQAALTLPAGLVYSSGSVQKTDRVKGRGAEVQASNSTGKLMIVETGGTIAPGEGAVITFRLRRNSNLTDGDYTIKLSEIIISDAEANQLNKDEESSVKIKAIGIEDCSFGAPEEIWLAVNQEYQVDVTLTNVGVNDLAAFQGKLALPEGLEIVPGEDGKFIYSYRTPVPLEFKFQESDGYTSFVLSSISNENIIDTQGVIFSFKVKATEALAETSEIKLFELRVANTAGTSAECDDVTINVTNKSAAVKTVFEDYKAEQIAAVEALAKEGDSEASQKIISDAKAAIEALAFDAEKSLDDNKAAVDDIVAPVAKALEEQRAADAIVPGDVNGDGEVDLSDAIMVTYYSLHEAPSNFNEAAADMNGDGEIDLSDAIIIIYISLGAK